MPAVVADVDRERGEMRGGSSDRFAGTAADLLGDSGESDCGGEPGVSICGGDLGASSPDSGAEFKCEACEAMMEGLAGCRYAVDVVLCFEENG